MVHNKWLLLAALMIAALLHSGQGKQLEGETREQDIEKEEKVDQLNVKSNESSRTPSKSKFKKYSATKKPVEVITADTNIVRKNDKAKTPTKTPVSTDEILDNLLQRMVGFLDSVSQDLHTAVQTLSEETPTEESENKVANTISPLKTPVSSDDKGLVTELRTLDRFVGQMVGMTHRLLDDVVADTENGNRRESSSNENLDSKMEEMMTAPTDMFDMLASLIFQVIPAMNGQFPPLPPFFFRTARTPNNPKTSSNQDRYKQLLTKEI